MVRDVLCVDERYSNFVNGKVYEAHSRFSRKIDGVKVHTDYEIIDEDGDSYPITDYTGQLNRGWEWV